MGSRADYRLTEQVGHGSFGKVYSAVFIPTGEIRAVKVIDLDASDDEMDDIQQEIGALQACSCPQLIRYYGSFTVGATLWIVMEYLEGGSLQELMRDSGVTLDEATIAWVMRDVLAALTELHGQRRIHRDVKAGNILVAGDGGVRLSDFGVSAQLTASWGKRKTFVGSPFWMAPEVIAETEYDACADVWSLGITAIELALGKPPHADKHPLKAVLLVPKEPPPMLPADDPRFSRRFAAFLEMCLVKDPKQRATAAELSRHPFVRGVPRTAALKELVEARKAAAVVAEIMGGGRAGNRSGGGGAAAGAGVGDDSSSATFVGPHPGGVRSNAPRVARTGSGASDGGWDFSGGDEELEVELEGFSRNINISGDSGDSCRSAAAAPPRPPAEAATPPPPPPSGRAPMVVNDSVTAPVSPSPPPPLPGDTTPSVLRPVFGSASGDRQLGLGYAGGGGGSSGGGSNGSLEAAGAAAAAAAAAAGATSPGGGGAESGIGGADSSLPIVASVSPLPLRRPSGSHLNLAKASRLLGVDNIKEAVVLESEMVKLRQQQVEATKARQKQGLDSTAPVALVTAVTAETASGLAGGDVIASRGRRSSAFADTAAGGRSRSGGAAGSNGSGGGMAAGGGGGYAAKVAAGLGMSPILGGRASAMDQSAGTAGVIAGRDRFSKTADVSGSVAAQASVGAAADRSPRRRSFSPARLRLDLAAATAAANAPSKLPLSATAAGAAGAGVISGGSGSSFGDGLPSPPSVGSGGGGSGGIGASGHSSGGGSSSGGMLSRPRSMSLAGAGGMLRRRFSRSPSPPPSGLPRAAAAAGEAAAADAAGLLADGCSGGSSGSSGSGGGSGLLAMPFSRSEAVEQAVQTEEPWPAAAAATAAAAPAAAAAAAAPAAPPAVVAAAEAGPKHARRKQSENASLSAGSGGSIGGSIGGSSGGSSGGGGSGAATAEENEEETSEAFAEMLAPALAEMWEATAAGSDARRAVEQMALAMERLDRTDPTGTGTLTERFVRLVLSINSHHR